jgi:hypothetical protein
MRGLGPFNGRTGAVGLTSAGVGAGEASTASPALTGAAPAPAAAPTMTMITQRTQIGES